MATKTVKKYLGTDALSLFTYVVAITTLSAAQFGLYLEAPLYYDEALFLVYGEQILEGAELYADLADHKPPGIFAVSVVVNALFSEPYLAGRVLVYIVHLLTAGGVGYLAMRLRSGQSGALASLLYLGGVYLPHFFGFVMLTEPFANLFLIVGAISLFSHRLSGAVVSGTAFAVAGLFNQIALMIGLPVLVAVTVRWRFENSVNLKRLVSVIAAIGTGFLGVVVSVGWYFVSRGTLEAAFRYTVVIPLSGYDTPFRLWGHILAFTSFLPVWVLVFIAFIGTLRGYRATGWVDSREVYLIVWFVLLGLPGATSLSGDHKLLFAFPPACILAGLALTDGYGWLRSLQPTGSNGSAAVGGKPLGERLQIGVLLVAVGIITVALFVNGYLLAGQVDRSVTEQIEDAGEVDEVVDGRAYTLPFRHYVYYFSTDIEPPLTFAGLPYSEALAEEIIVDLERTEVQYILVPAERVTENDKIARVGLFLDARERIIDYANQNYRPVSRTGGFVVFERVAEGSGDRQIEI